MQSGQYFPKQTYKIHDVDFEKNNTGPKIIFEKLKIIKNLRSELKSERATLSKETNAIKKNCMNRHYKDLLKNDCEEFKRGNTKGIWAKIKHIRNCDDKTSDKSGNHKFQPLRNDKNELTNNTEENIKAWNEYINTNFKKASTEPIGTHLKEQDFDGPEIEFFTNNIGKFASLVNEREKKDFIFRSLIYLGSPCSDADIEKWFYMLTLRDNARLTRFFNENDESDFLLENLCNAFSKEEISFAIRNLKNGKALDNKRIPAEIIKQNINFFTTYFYEIFNDVFKNNKELPADWLNALLIMLRKRKDKTLRDNYRPVCLVSMAYKILTIAITNRLQPIMNLLTDCTQAAYKSNHSRADILYIFNKLIKNDKMNHDANNINENNRNAKKKQITH